MGVGEGSGTRRSTRVTPSSATPVRFFLVFFLSPDGTLLAQRLRPADRNISGGEKGADREISGEAGEGRRVSKCQRSGMTESEIETQTFAEPRLPPLRPPMGSEIDVRGSSVPRGVPDSFSLNIRAWTFSQGCWGFRVGGGSRVFQ